MKLANSQTDLDATRVSDSVDECLKLAEDEAIGPTWSCRGLLLAVSNFCFGKLESGESMNCPKCGKKATKDMATTYVIHSSEDALDVNRIGSKRVLIRYIHYDCAKCKTPNFVFYVEKGDA